jgi:hypothetical protein
VTAAAEAKPKFSSAPCDALLSPKEPVQTKQASGQQISPEAVKKTSFVSAFSAKYQDRMTQLVRESRELRDRGRAPEQVCAAVAKAVAEAAADAAKGGRIKVPSKVDSSHSRSTAKVSRSVAGKSTCVGSSKGVMG